MKLLGECQGANSFVLSKERGGYFTREGCENDQKGDETTLSFLCFLGGFLHIFQRGSTCSHFRPARKEETRQLLSGILHGGEWRWWGPPGSFVLHLARLLGRANQRLAAAADCVVLMVAGIPMAVKG